MFSDVGRSLDQDTIEYAWLLEIQMGKLSGKLTSPQLYSILASLETLVLLLCDSENELTSPKYDIELTQPPVAQSTTSALQHLPQHVQQALQNFLQPKNSNSNASNKSGAQTSFGNTSKTAQSGKNTGKEEKLKQEAPKGKNFKDTEVILDECDSHKLKYKFCRVAIDAVDFWLVESGAALQLWTSPVRLATCNLHGKQVCAGLSCVIYGMSLHQMVWQPHKYNHSKSNNEPSDLWLEVGAVNFDPLVIESATSSDDKSRNSHAIQQKFLKAHDEKLKKLWFLWPETNKNNGRCGCTGGCVFFGGNRNGPRFFKPSRKDLEDGMNIAAFRVNEPGKDPGYGQSILHEGMLIFRTTPYIPHEISLQDNYESIKRKRNVENSKVCCNEKSGEAEQIVSYSSPTVPERKTSRRYSSTSIRSSILKDVPYSRLIDNSSALPAKLDSDSKLHSERGKLIVCVPDSELLPKNSVSDSKLAVDYFNAPVNYVKEPMHSGSGPSSEISVSPQMPTKPVNISESHYSLGGRISSDEKMKNEIQRTISMSSENHSEAFFSADEDGNVNSRSSSLRSSMLVKQDSVPQQT